MADYLDAGMKALQGASGLGNAYAGITNENASDFQKGLQALSGGAAAADAAGHLSGLGGIPYVGPLIQAANLGTHLGSGNTDAFGQAGIGALASSAGAAAVAPAIAAGALPAAASGVGAIVAIPAIAGMLFGRGGLFGRKPVAPDLYEIAAHQQLGRSISSGQTPDLANVWGAENLAQLAQAVGVSPERLMEVGGQYGPIGPNTMANHYTRPDGSHYFGPIGDPLARLLNPQGLGYYNPLGAMQWTNTGEGGPDAGYGPGEHIANLVNMQRDYDRGRQQAEVFGILPQWEQQWQETHPQWQSAFGGQAPGIATPSSASVPGQAPRSAEGGGGGGSKDIMAQARDMISNLTSQFGGGISDLYQRNLGRTPTSQEMSSGVESMSGGASLADLQGQLFRGVPMDQAKGLVDQNYASLFGRAPSDAERGNAPLEGLVTGQVTPQQWLQQLQPVAREEFFKQHAEPIGREVFAGRGVDNPYYTAERLAEFGQWSRPGAGDLDQFVTHAQQFLGLPNAAAAPKPQAGTNPTVQAQAGGGGTGAVPGATASPFFDPSQVTGAAA